MDAAKEKARNVRHVREVLDHRLLLQSWGYEVDQAETDRLYDELERLTLTGPALTLADIHKVPTGKKGKP